MGWIFGWKLAWLVVSIIFALIAWRLFRKDDGQPVVKEFKIWKLVSLTEPHSGTVFVALAATCVIVSITTKVKYTSGPDGEHIAYEMAEETYYDELAELEPYDEVAMVEMVEEVPPTEMGQYPIPEERRLPERTIEMRPRSTSIIMKGGPEDPWGDDDSAEDEP